MRGSASLKAGVLDRIVFRVALGDNFAREESGRGPPTSLALRPRVLTPRDHFAHRGGGRGQRLCITSCCNQSRRVTTSPRSYLFNSLKEIVMFFVGSLTGRSGFEDSAVNDSRDENAVIAAALAGLGYPGLSYLETSSRNTPAEVLLSALKVSDLESRLVEALPWLLVEYTELDWHWLEPQATIRGLQNRLGFITSLARRIAERSGQTEKVVLLREKESVLQRSRREAEDTLCHESLTHAERLWLHDHRTDEAKHWNILSDLCPDHLSYLD